MGFAFCDGCDVSYVTSEAEPAGPNCPRCSVPLQPLTRDEFVRRVYSGRSSKPFTTKSLPVLFC